MAALLTALTLVLGALLTGAVTAGPAGATSTEDTFTAKLNYARTSRGIPRLTPRSALITVARQQAQRMASSNTLFHNPNLTKDVTNWRWVGENVGYGPDALTVHVAFMNSPGHRANILDRDYTEVGIGAVTVNGRVWVAEVFRRPMRVTTSSTGTTLAPSATPCAPAAPAPPSTRVQARLHLRQTGLLRQLHPRRPSPASRAPGLARSRQRRPEDLVPAVLRHFAAPGASGAAHARRRQSREEGSATGAVPCRRRAAASGRRPSAPPVVRFVIVRDVRREHAARVGRQRRERSCPALPYGGRLGG